ncbi:MAG TPA: hypothetical protein VMN37_11825 [Gemmatimonadales bacterium]|nr:hypothetical protein [Gemmatimonadales bacterium]
MLAAVLVVLAAVALAAVTYLRLERLGRRGWIPMTCRAVAWSALGLLVLNLGCPAPGEVLRPLVLLDGSLSLGAPGARWAEARDSAMSWGDVRTFGDERAGGDSVPSRGLSLLGSALAAAAASVRPIIVVTDGEIEDGPDLPPELIGRASVRVFPRDTTPDLAIASVTGPSRAAAGDTILLEVELQAVGGADADSIRVEVLAGSTRVAGRTARLSQGSARARLRVPSSALGAGDQLLRVLIAGADDAEPRTDTRLHLVTVTPTPGVVLLASPADWDSRFLFRALRDVAQLPVRGFARLDGDRWRSMTDLSPVPADRVRAAARRADLLILKGAVDAVGTGTAARGIWAWPSGEGQEVPLPGDWYLQASEVSPLAGAFLGQPVDSFPPASRLQPLATAPGDWVALSAQLGRRGGARPAVVGREEGQVRRVVVGADGLWRWAFRGGSSEQSYRAWVAATASWLLGGADSVRGLARPVRPVVPNGRPLVFEWAGPGPARPVAIGWTGPAGERMDTLRFDGAGRAPLWLEPGEYRYRLEGGGGGTAAVESYSDELLPRPLILGAREARVSRPMGRTTARERLWLFALCVLALAGEWFARRRLGLR